MMEICPRSGHLHSAFITVHFALHNNRFDVDERCFEVGIGIFTNFVLENQEGIDLEEKV